MSDINSIIDLLDKEYETSVLEINKLKTCNTELEQSKNDLMSVNEELRSEIGSQNESLAELNELRKLNIELQDEIETLSSNN